MSVSPDTTNGGLSCGTSYTAKPPSGNWFTCGWTAQIVSDTTAATIEIRTPRDALRKSDRYRLRTGQIRLIGFAPSKLSNACANAPMIADGRRWLHFLRNRTRVAPQ